MLDLKAKREANMRRLMGEDEKTARPYTIESLTDNEVCWDIVSIVCRKKTVEVKRGDKSYMRQTNELAYPELGVKEIVGSRKTQGDKRKKEYVTRTNIDTMEEMYQFRNAMVRHYSDDKDESYLEYFESLLEVLDTYANQVCIDMIEKDETLLGKINKIRGAKNA